MFVRLVIKDMPVKPAHFGFIPRKSTIGFCKQKSLLSIFKGIIMWSDLVCLFLLNSGFLFHMTDSNDYIK